VSIRRKIENILESKQSNNEELSSQDMLQILDCIKESSTFTSQIKVLTNNPSISTGTPSIKTSKLTKRQLHIFKLIGLGLHSKEIAKELNLSLNTITTHRKNIIKRLELKGAGQLQRLAQRHLLSDQGQKNT